MPAGVNCPFDLAECPACGMVQRCSNDELPAAAAAYDSDYYVFQEPDERRWARGVQQYILHLAPLEGRMGPMRRVRPRLLEVGCALGHFGALATARGWRYTGIDVSADAVSRAAERFALDVRAGSLARHLDTMHRFDAIFLGDVIEHVLDPLALVRLAAKALSPGGFLCIDTPNWGSRWRRWGGRRWLALNPFHVSFFNANGITRLLGAAGFGEVQTASYTHYRYESWAARPELEPLWQWLPAALRWRATKAMGRFPRRTAWAALRNGPPADLNGALRLTAEWSDSPDVSACVQGFGDRGDNLIASAVRH